MTWSSASPRQPPGGAASKGPDYQDPGIDPGRLRNGCLDPLEEGGAQITDHPAPRPRIPATGAKIVASANGHTDLSGPGAGHAGLRHTGT